MMPRGSMLDIVDSASLVIDPGAGSSPLTSRLDPKNLSNRPEAILRTRIVLASPSLSVDFVGETAPHEGQMISLLI